MKSFNKIIAIVFAVIILMIGIVNIIPSLSNNERTSILKVDINRIVREI